MVRSVPATESWLWAAPGATRCWQYALVLQAVEPLQLFSCAQAPGYLVFSAPLYRSGAQLARARSATQLGSGCRGREGHSLMFGLSAGCH